MPSKPVTCPICRGNATQRDPPTRDAIELDCPRCGRPIIVGSLFRSGAFAETLGQEDLGWALSAFTRQATERGEQIILDTRNWRDLARAHMGTSVVRKLRMLLELLGNRTAAPGALAAVNYETDASLIDAKVPGEVRFHLEALKDAGFIKITSGHTPGTIGAVVTAKGWEACEPAATQGIPGRCFVAMSFDTSLGDAWNLGIYLAVKDDCKCEPRRIDLIHHNEKICDRIVAEIRQAQFVVADFTLHRQNVYFEAGFALGLGRPVVWSCREDQLNASHFDTRQYAHVVWKEPADLRQKLADRIQATILK